MDDLIRGRFDYVPYSILSGTHLLHFDGVTVTDLFEASGYRIVAIEGQTLPASPQGTLRRDQLARFPGASRDLDVSEFVVVATAH